MQCTSCNADNPAGALLCVRCSALLPTGPTEEAADPLIGQTVGGRYTIRKVLGEGGMGRVYEATRKLAGVEQRVAVKTLHKHLSNDDQIKARFHRECGTVAQLKHPNTIKVEDFGQTPTGELYIAMEFVDGRSIAKELQPHGHEHPARPLDPARVERILEQVCGSLAEAHQQGVVHRDLKPENIILMDVGGDRDFVKVLDFGIAARKDQVDAVSVKKLTQQGMVLGTPPYMSPEQFTGKELDARSDIYSLAIMAYEMLTGNLPFEADTPWEWATKHMTEVPRPFEQWPTGAAVPPKMRQALMRALAKKPEQRQSTVREFLDDFSVGGGRGRTSMPSHETPGAIMPPTSAMSSFDAPGAPHRTEIATPYMPAGGPGMGPGGPGMGPGGPGMGPGGHGMGPGPGAGYGPPPGAFAAPPPPPPGYGGGNESKGPNRGLIAALAGAAGLTVLVSIGLAVRHSMNRDSGSGERLDVPTTTAPATVATLPPNALPSGAAPTTTVPVVPGVPTIKPTGTAKPPGTAPTTTPPPTTPTTPPTAPPGVSGDAACVEARDRANKREISSAVAVFRACNGPSRSSAQSAIRGQTPNAVRDAVFRNECGKARRIAADGASAGARSIDVDREYPQCKGR